MKRIIKFALFGLLGFSFPALATKPVDPAKFVFDSSLGYILVRVGPVAKAGDRPPFLLLTRMDDEGYPLWSSSPATADNTKFPDAAVIWKGRSWQFDGDSNLYLVPVTAGRWLIAAGANTSFSLGSYSFDVKPGKITYIGKVLIGREDGNSNVPEIREAILSQDLINFGVLMNIVMSETFVLRKPDGNESFPEKISSAGVERADIVGDIIFNNFTNGLVSRAADLPPRLVLRALPLRHSTLKSATKLELNGHSAGKPQNR